MEQQQIPQEIIEQLSRMPIMARTIALLEEELAAARTDKALLHVRLEQAAYEIDQLYKEKEESAMSENAKAAPQETTKEVAEPTTPAE
ncbi:MAG: hypothetical protein ABJG42_24385 [Vibrio splendidus]